ncbi:MAG: alcohol dehydrogenase [Ilumatobacteraceae bacterium]|nr:alcohol dehydrogenase [Ilumatobacteraceae bacterium]
MTSTTPTTMRAWRTHEYGQPADVLVLDEIPVPEPGPGEVLVKVLAAPLNLNDLERVNGGNMAVKIELPYGPGMETMGIVEACGAGAEALLGKRVVGTTKLAHGGFAEYVVCGAGSTFEMPDSIALPDAACLYFPYHLAWLGLYDRAELQAGETVLIHAAAGGSGSAAIQLAKHVGAKVIASVGSDAKKQLCLDLGADVVVNYKTEDFAAVVMAETGQRGVDVVFDNVGDAVFAGSMNCIAYNGRYLMMGFASDKTFADEKYVVPRRLMMANVKLCGVLLGYMPDAMIPMVKGAIGANFAPSSLGEKIMAGVVELVLSGAIKPVIGKVVDFADVPAALTAMSNSDTVGRVVAVL